MLLSACSNNGFTDSEISDMEAEIKLSYEQKGWHSIEIALVRETDTKLKGFVNGTIKSTKYETQRFGAYGMFSRQVAVPSETKVSVECTANKDVKNKKSFWQCKKS